MASLESDHLSIAYFLKVGSKHSWTLKKDHLLFQAIQLTKLALLGRQAQEKQAGLSWGPVFSDCGQQGHTATEGYINLGILWFHLLSTLDEQRTFFWGKNYS